MTFKHRNSHLVVFGLFTAILVGCFPAVFPTNVRETIKTIDSETIGPISKGQPIPGRIKNLKWGKISIYLKENLCPCNGRTSLKFSVAEVDTTGLKGYEIFSGYTTGQIGNWFWMRIGDEDKTMCTPFVEAENAISDATKSSYQRHFYFPDSYELVWEAERALRTLECDPVRSKILADKALEIAMDEGAKALGLNVSGTYDSEISGKHSVISMLYEHSGNKNPDLVIKEIDNEIWGTDSSGNALIKGKRLSDPSKPLMRDVITFKVSHPDVSKVAIEGQWTVGDDASSLEGEWHDSGSNASGRWNLFRIDQTKRAEPQIKIQKHLKKFYSRKSAFKIEWNQIEKILVPGKDADWVGCLVVGGVIPICTD